MRKNLLFIVFFWLSIFAFGQAPQAFRYQAVARNLDGNPIVSQVISVKISIVIESPEGTVVYSEVHQVSTNILGLFDLAVGTGTVLNGSFTEIDWGNNPYFIRIEMDITGGENYTLFGTSQLLSVPYSLHSGNGIPDGNSPGEMLYWNGSQWVSITGGSNGQVLTFIDGIPTWTTMQMVVINTLAVQNITATSASSGGTIASDGGSPITARGICWNTAPNPTTANNKTTNGSGSGTFSATMTGLTPAATYYVRSYATNGMGTFYGNQLSFTTQSGIIALVTAPASSVMALTAVSGGTITSSGGLTVTSRGVCWNTAPNPTTANFKTVNGNGTGTFVSELTGLIPNTIYYVRAYGINSLGTHYGNEVSFTTQNGIVTLTTAEVTSITSNTAISGGEITSDGGSAITERGVCWSSSLNPTIADQKTSNGNGTGLFGSELAGLNPNTLYYLRAYATNGFGTYYGNEVSFTTLEWTCGASFTIHHVAGEVAPVDKTVTYGTVTNIPGEPSKCWITNNLGADRQATAVNDTSEASAGWYWQFNRKQGYKHDGTTRTPNTNWITNINETLSWEAANDPCAIELGNGWRVPGYPEWVNLVANGGWINWNGPWNSGLRLHAGGGLNYTDGSLTERGITGAYWSNQRVSDDWGWFLLFNGVYCVTPTQNKAHGFTLRCVKGEATTTFLFVTPANQDVTASAGTTTFEVTSNAYWTVNESVSWLSVSPMSGFKNSLITVSYDENYSSDPRIGQITVTIASGNPAEIVTVSQDGAPQWTCGQPITDERDGKTYNTVQIGNQCWMKENLNVGTMVNGDQEMTDNGIIEKYCYNDGEANCDTFGGLYQWDEMMDYSTTAGVQGICITGWHVPFDDEWTTLTNYVSSQPDFLCNSNTNYIAKALAANTLWNTHTGACTVGNNLAANNATGFTGLPGGGRGANGSFFDIVDYGYWLSSSEYSATIAWERNLNYDNAEVGRGYGNKEYGFSVRCLRD